MDFIEVSAKTVDEAITKACIELEISSDRLDIQVITEGSSGFLGFGSKPAVIKVRKKEEPEKEPEVPEEEPVKEAPKPAEKPEKKEKPKASRKEGGKKDSPKKEKSASREHVPAKEETPLEKTEEEIVTMKASATRFLDGVFKAMELPVEITMEYHRETGSLDIDFAGEDMGILIGKRGQTLDSLQYLTSLVVNKDQKEYVRVKLDTEDYRKRRKETLENLAKNIAYKVRRTRKPVSLEPMNPYERRIIHSALQGNKYVETYSEGNEPYRHVVVSLKK
jgi:spoIIIJ-associated protein